MEAVQPLPQRKLAGVGARCDDEVLVRELVTIGQLHSSTVQIQARRPGARPQFDVELGECRGVAQEWSST